MTSEIKPILLTRGNARAFWFMTILALVLTSTPAALAQKAPAAAGDSRYATLEGARIHYQSHGKGREALVLIHGWTCNLDHWRDQVPDFAKRNRVITIDLPGHGQSDKPEIRYSMDLFEVSRNRDSKGVKCLILDCFRSKTQAEA